MSCDSNESGASSARAQRCSSRLSLRQLCSSSVSFASYSSRSSESFAHPGALATPCRAPWAALCRPPLSLGHGTAGRAGANCARARARGCRAVSGIRRAPLPSAFPYPWLRKGPSGAPTGIRLLVSCRFLWVPLSEDLPPEQASARSLLPVPLLPLLLLFLLLLLLPPTSLTSAPALQSCPPAGGSSFQAVDWHPSAE